MSQKQPNKPGAPAMAITTVSQPDWAARRAEQLAKRRAAIAALSASRGDSHVITYVTANRPNFGTAVGGDVIRLFRDHLGKLPGKVPRIDLFLTTNGGHALTPLRLMSLLREYSESVSVLVPYMAHSAGTLIALGADEIVMGAMGELGPVDPSVANQFNPLVEAADVPGAKLPVPRPRHPISVEDVIAYLSLAKDRAGLDGHGMAAAFTALTDDVHPLALGNILRNHTLIRHLVKKLLSMHMTDGPTDKVESIVETLTEKLHAHDYLITRPEAEAIGLKAVKPSAAADGAMWELYTLYEAHLELGRQTPDVGAQLGPASQGRFVVEAAAIESKDLSHVFCFKGNLAKKASGELSVDVDGNQSGWSVC